MSGYCGFITLKAARDALSLRTNVLPGVLLLAGVAVRLLAPLLDLLFQLAFRLLAENFGK